MKIQKILIMFMILLIGIVPLISAQIFIPSGTNSEDFVFEETKEASFFDLIFESLGLLSIRDLQTSYQAGDTISVLVTETLKNDCSGEAVFFMDIYDTSVSGQSSKNPISFDLVRIGSQTDGISSGTYQTRMSYHIPSTASGTWSIDAYLKCFEEGGGGEESSHDRVNFAIEGQNSCVDTTWSPSPSTICSPAEFVQTSNCENKRQISGTKDCNFDTCKGLNGVSCSGEQRCYDGVVDVGYIDVSDSNTCCIFGSCDILGEDELEEPAVKTCKNIQEGNFCDKVGDCEKGSLCVSILFLNACKEPLTSLEFEKTQEKDISCFSSSPINVCNNDNTCDSSESFETCPSDCKLATCGNLICDKTEDFGTCPIDCTFITGGGDVLKLLLGREQEVVSEEKAKFDAGEDLTPEEIDKLKQVFCNKAIGTICEPPSEERFGLGDGSGPSDECASGWCRDITFGSGKCAKVGTDIDGKIDTKAGFEPHPICFIEEEPGFDWNQEVFLGILLWQLLIGIGALVFVFVLSRGKR